MAASSANMRLKDVVTYMMPSYTVGETSNCWEVPVGNAQATLRLAAFSGVMSSMGECRWLA